MKIKLDESQFGKRHFQKHKYVFYALQLNPETIINIFNKKRKKLKMEHITAEHTNELIAVTKNQYNLWKKSKVVCMKSNDKISLSALRAYVFVKNLISGVL